MANVIHYDLLSGCRPVEHLALFMDDGTASAVHTWDGTFSVNLDWLDRSEDNVRAAVREYVGA